MKLKLRSNRGSALITVLLLTAGVLIMLASYHSLVMFNLRSSHRSFHASAAMNLAETGLEEGLWALNQVRAGNTSGFNGWTVSGNVATREYSDVFSVGSAASTYVKVKVTNCNLTSTTPPTIKAQARLGMNGAAGVEKWVEIVLDTPASGTPGKKGPPAIGFVSRNEIKFNGTNPIVDSWNSDPGRTGSMTHTYNSLTKDDHGFVASTDVSVDSITVSNADIKGYVATYKDADLSNNVGPNGSILSDESPAGTKIDASRVSTDFTADFPPVTSPTGGAALTAASVPATGATNYTRSVEGGKVIYRYSYATGTISGALEIKPHSPTGTPVLTETIMVNDPVTNTMIATVVPVVTEVSIVVSRISLTGASDGIDIQTGAALNLYASGDVTIAGKGVANGTPVSASTGLTAADMQQPSRFNLYGTSTSSQTIKVAGNGALSGVIYAPNGDITFTGNTPMIFGAATGKTITISGNAQVHYDEALGQNAFGTPADSGNSALKIELWRELLAASERTFL
jgi:Tfp pilus assembly protein PilX